MKTGTSKKAAMPFHNRIFYCPACKRKMTRMVQGNPKTHRSFCEKTGKSVLLQSRSCKGIT